MLLTNRISWLILCLIVAACTEAPPRQTAPDGMPIVQMQFAENPERLFAAVTAVCARPDQRVIRASEDEVECRRLLPPEGAAGAILGFDGTLEALPESVLRFETDTTPDGAHLVRASSYLAVPQRDGSVRRVVFPDRRVDRTLTRMLTKLGGTPYPAP